MMGQRKGGQGQFFYAFDLDKVVPHAGLIGENGPTGQRFSSAGSAGDDRAAWRMVQRFCPEKSEAQCREIIRTWEEEGVLVTRPYYDSRQRKELSGLYIDDAKRPGTATRVEVSPESSRIFGVKLALRAIIQIEATEQRRDLGNS